MKRTRTFGFIPLALCAAFGASATLPAHALEITPGDYEVYPPGVNIGVVYFQRAQRTDLKVNGDTATDDFKFDSNVVLFRYIRPYALSETLTADLNVILPLVQLETGGAAEGLGDASGAGDLSLGVAFKRLLDPETRDAVSLGLFANLPTGSYDADDILNTGDNRVSLVIQGAHVKHFANGWGLDTAADVQIFGTNDDFTPAGVNREQDPRFELQAHVRYNPAPTTIYGVGLGHVRGGETKVDGDSQNDELETTYLRLTASHFVNQTNQLQVQLGRDLAVDNGPAEAARLNLRWGVIF